MPQGKILKSSSRKKSSRKEQNPALWQSFYMTKLILARTQNRSPILGTLATSRVARPKGHRHVDIGMGSYVILEF